MTESRPPHPDPQPGRRQQGAPIIRTRLRGWIIHFGGDDSADAAPRIRGVAVAAWNQVDVGVKNGLPGRGPAIHPDIETGDARIGLRDPPAQDPDQSIGVSAFLLRQRKPVRRVPFGDDEKVSLGDRMTVLDRPH